jgi:uncharacterized membrane protein YhaH (DUF805 family)
MEYWMFVLINVLVTIALCVVDFMAGTISGAGMPLISGLYSLAVLIPSLAVAIRRLHDTDRSGWWLLIFLIPLIGPLVLLVFLLLDGTPGDNRHGVSPKAAAA